MANPQAENGHIDIANEIAEALCRLNLSPYQSRVLWAIFRKTYGWHKKEDCIPLSQFCELTGLAKPLVSRTMKALIARNIIKRNGKSIGFQKDYEQWKVIIRDNPSKELSPEITKVITRDNKRLPLEITSKEIKETTQKKRGRKQVSSTPLENQQVRELFAALRERRGYNSDKPGAEAKAMHWMLQQGYTNSDILNCHDYLKSQPFWRHKPLTMMSVKGQIGEWRGTRGPRQQDEEWRMR